MRVYFPRPVWLRVGILSLSVASLTGCKTMPAPPGLGWLGWWSDPKPAASSLSTAPPVRPSVANLPPPSASTGNASGYNASSTSLTSYPSGTGVTGAGNGQSPSGYSVGQYSMTGAQPYAGQGHSGQPLAAQGHAAQGHAGHGHAGHSHSPANPGAAYGGNLGSAASSQPAQAPAHSGYQSPYATSAATGGQMRTADSRSLYSANETAPKQNPYVASSNNAAAGGWNDDNRGPGNSYTAPQGVAAESPTRGLTGSPAGYSSAGGSWTPGDAGSALTPSADRVLDSDSLTPPPIRRDGTFRPGSTGRNSSVLPAAGSGPAASSPQQPAAPAGYGSAYPSTSYPSTGYPSLGGSERAAAGGEYSYPSMPQRR